MKKILTNETAILNAIIKLNAIKIDDLLNAFKKLDANKISFVFSALNIVDIIYITVEAEAIYLTVINDEDLVYDITVEICNSRISCFDNF